MEEEDESTIVMRRAQEKTRGHLNMRNISKILSLQKRERTKAQLATLIKYFRNVKIFRDMILGRAGGDPAPAGGSGEGQDTQAITKEEEDASFEHLASTVRVEKIKKAGHVLMEEGQPGDLFYIILEGDCTVLKASPIVIHSMVHEEDIQDRALAYFRVIM